MSNEAPPHAKRPPQDLYPALGLLLAVVPLTSILGRLEHDGGVNHAAPSMLIVTPLAFLGAFAAIALHRKLAPRHAELGVVVPAGLLLAASVGIRAATLPSPAWTWVHPLLSTLEGFAVAGGAFPLVRYAREHLGLSEVRIVAGALLSAAVFLVVLGAGVAELVPAERASLRFLALLLALMLGSVWALVRMPVVFMRFLTWLLARVVYRVRVVDSAHIAMEGPQVLVCNHIAFVDWLVVAGTSPRPARFVMDRGNFGLPVIRTLATIAEVIPIAPRKIDPDLLERSFDRISEALDRGEVVCIFPEGAISRDGRMQVFRPGIERIIARNPVPVVPMALGGMWGSFFSRIEGSAMKRPFRRGIFNRIALVVGPPIAPEAVTAEGLRETVADLLVRAEALAGTGRGRDEIA